MIQDDSERELKGYNSYIDNSFYFSRLISHIP